MKRDYDWEARLQSGPFRDDGLRPELRAAIRERIGWRKEERIQVRRYRQAAAVILFVLLIGGGAVYAANQPEMWDGILRGGPVKQEAQAPDARATIDPSTAEGRSAGGNAPGLQAMEGPVELNVMQGLSGDFMRRHGGYFEALNPHISLKAKRPIHSDGTYMTFTLDEIRTYILEEQPDLVSLSLSQYEALAGEGLLLPLEPYAGRDGFDFSDFHPAVMDVLREAGGGSVQGLTENYYAKLVFVRPEVLRAAGLPVPEAGERLSWQQLFDTGAALYAAGYPGLIAGISDEAAMLADAMASAEGIELLDPKTGKANAGAEQWPAIWQAVVDGVGSGAIFTSRPVEKIGTPYEPGERRIPNPLPRGEGALYYGSAIEFLDTVPADKRGEWLALPAPGEGGWDLNLGDIYAIPKNAVHPDEAWALLKSAMGDANPNDPEPSQWYYRLYAHLGKAERVMGEDRVEALRAKRVDAAAVVRAARIMTGDSAREMYMAYGSMYSYMEDILQGGSLTIEESLSRVKREIERATSQ